MRGTENSWLIISLVGGRWRSSGWSGHFLFVAAFRQNAGRLPIPPASGEGRLRDAIGNGILGDALELHQKVEGEGIVVCLCGPTPVWNPLAVVESICGGDTRFAGWLAGKPIFVVTNRLIRTPSPRAF